MHYEVQNIYLFEIIVIWHRRTLFVTFASDLFQHVVLARRIEQSEPREQQESRGRQRSSPESHPHKNFGVRGVESKRRIPKPGDSRLL
jgi:hypothetical protein